MMDTYHMDFWNFFYMKQTNQIFLATNCTLLCYQNEQ